jgi:hypothetical protein
LSSQGAGKGLQIGVECVRTIGNFFGINPGGGNEGKKFAYHLYFEYDKIN